MCRLERSVRYAGQAKPHAAQSMNLMCKIKSQKCANITSSPTNTKTQIHTKTNTKTHTTTRIKTHTKTHTKTKYRNTIQRYLSPTGLFTANRGSKIFSHIYSQVLSPSRPYQALTIFINKRNNLDFKTFTF